MIIIKKSRTQSTVLQTVKKESIKREIHEKIIQKYENTSD